MLESTVRYCRAVRKTGHGNGGLRWALSKVSSRLSGALVLSEDILSVPEDQVREIKPVMTIVGGKTVFQQGF